MKLDVIHKTTFRNYPAQKIHILVIYETITIYLSILSSIFLSNLSIHLYIYLSIYLSIFLSYLSIYLYIYLSIYLSI